MWSFSELPPAMQRIVTNISAVSFPRDRVVQNRNDEKKGVATVQPQSNTQYLLSLSLSGIP